MNCRQANRLLPLWIGRDLADASESEALRGHLAECPDCANRRSKLQESLDALQSVATGMVGGEMHVARRPSIWPRLATMLGEVPRRRDQFNGWIPAAAMASLRGQCLRSRFSSFSVRWATPIYTWLARPPWIEMTTEICSTPTNGSPPVLPVRKSFPMDW